MEKNDMIETAYELGTRLGREQACCVIAQRCTAAVAESLNDIKEKKLYLAVENTWEAFCSNRLGISRAFADKIIRQLRDLGPDYFKLNSFARITPAEYRRIAFAVTGDGLTHNGETIPLESDYAPKIVETVNALRSEMTPETPPLDPADQAFAKAEKSLQTALAEFQRLQEMHLDEEGRLKLLIAVEAGRDGLERIRASTDL
jgi:hypothetical protein